MNTRLVIAVLLALTIAVNAYNRDAAARQSNAICGLSQGNSGCDGSHFGCCTDLTMKSLAAGGVTVRSRMASGQAQELKNMGWRTNSSCRACTPGQVLYYPNMGHVAFCGTGRNRNQWNPGRCGAGIYWGEALQCLSAP